MNYNRKSYDIIGYTYRAEILCPGCTIEALPTGEGEQFDGWAVTGGVRVTPEENLTELAYAFGINRNDESSFDSDEFPKVVFEDQREENETCSRCGGEL